MRVTYVLPEPVLSGGNKVALQHAQLLVEAGHETSVLASGGRPAWTSFTGRWHDATAGAPVLAAQDAVVATFWPTVEVARRLDAGPVAHFCQGYEGSNPHLAGQRAAIDAVYALPLPTLVVSPHLADLVGGRFGRSARLVPPVVDPLFRPRPRPLAPRRRPRVAVCGIFEAAVKDVPTALAAVARLRASGVAAELVRVSNLPPTAAETALLPARRYHCDVAPRTVAAVLRGCDLLLFTSRPDEGFGLPVLEAMASGVPVVASDIPSVRFMTRGDGDEGGGDGRAGTAAVALAPPGDDDAFAAAARVLLADRRRWRAARGAGRRAARRFAPEAVLPRLEAALAWVASTPVRGDAGEASAGGGGLTAGRPAGDP